MNILLTGVTGYIGKRLLPVLLDEGHMVICCVRDKRRFHQPEQIKGKVHILEIDFLNPDIDQLPFQIDVAYYLMHSLGSSIYHFEQREAKIAHNFVELMDKSKAKQVIYLTGIVNDEHLSPHLRSRKNTEKILSTSKVPLTVLRAGIIVGSGSASFEIIRDLVEKLPIMIAPKWIRSKIQPIAVSDVIKVLIGCLGKKEIFSRSFDIGGPEVLTYKQMLYQYAEVRGLKRSIITLPVMTPRLSSYWLYFLTSVSYKIAVNLVNSLKVNVVCRDNDLLSLLDIKPIPYKEAVQRAFGKIAEHMVASSWKDAFISSASPTGLMNQVQVPQQGCFKESVTLPLHASPDKVKENLWAIGGERGWYYADLLWKLRGFLDKFVGGIGLRRGRTNRSMIQAGDALDFWRVILADKEKGRLILYAEMKLPGEAWLEWSLEGQHAPRIRQVATFRPVGLWGRLYWHLMYVPHRFIFKGMLRNIIRYDGPKAVPAHK